VRLAVLSDIHSNIFALQAVLEDVLKRRADHVLNLGDIFYGPIAPKATYELLMEHNMITIRGNQDRQIYQAAEEESSANPTMRFVLDDLKGQPLHWLKTLPFDQQLSDGIYLCHGTPSDDSFYLLDDVATGRPRVRAEKDILALLTGQSSELILCGHTHLARTVWTRSGQLIVNPGSVGLPAYTDDAPVLHTMASYCPHAAYALLEKGRAGWTVQHLKVAYDFRRAAEVCTRRQRPDWAHFITTGRGVE